MNGANDKSMGYPVPPMGPTASGVVVRHEDAASGRTSAIWSRVAACIKPCGRVVLIQREDFYNWSFLERERIRGLMM